jgi:predicted NUDIX family NTP pyrophosphohydrolase
MPKLSAGIMVYKYVDGGVQVFLVHPGGPFWAKKDASAWSVPKGEYEESDDPWEAAKREFTEETGFMPPPGEQIDLGVVKYSNKLLTVWAVEGEVDASKVVSNTFTMEWPPKSGEQQEFPEVDRAGWFSLAIAQEKLVKGQVPLLERLAKALQVPIPLAESRAEPKQDQLSLF